LLRSSGQEIDDLLNGFVGAVVGGFEFAGRLVLGVGAVVEAAVGEWAAKPFVEEENEQRNLMSATQSWFGRSAVKFRSTRSGAGRASRSR